MSTSLDLAHYTSRIDCTTLVDRDDLKVWSVYNAYTRCYLLFWVTNPRAKFAKGFSTFRIHAEAESYAKVLTERADLVKSSKAAASSLKKEFRTSLKVGDILVGSWGYDQTNVEAVQVVDISETGKSVTVREIGLEAAGETSWCSEQCRPSKDAFIGTEVRLVVSMRDTVRWNSYCTLAKWNGNSMHRSWGA